MGLICISFYILGNTFHWLRLPLSIVGAVIILTYIYELSQEWTGQKPVLSLSSLMEEKLSDNRFLRMFTLAVLAVSWDCIPVAAGIASETDAWTLPQLAFGLSIIGLVVALCTQASIWTALLIKRLGYSSSTKTKVWAVLMSKWVILTLLTTFFFLSLASGASPWLGSISEPEVYQMLPFSIPLVTIFFLAKFRHLVNTQVIETVQKQNK